jgi:chromate reductase
MEMVFDSDGLIISRPEYVRGIPGGLKNAIDWLVSGDQIVAKPAALTHASHRGIDMLAALRTVLSTTSSNFNEKLFYQLPFMKETPESIGEILRIPANRRIAETFLWDFSSYCQAQGTSNPVR